MPPRKNWRFAIYLSKLGKHCIFNLGAILGTFTPKEPRKGKLFNNII